MCALVAPIWTSWLSEVNHTQLSVTGSVAGYVLIDYAECLGLLTEGTGGNCSLIPGVGKGDIGGISNGE